MKTLNRGMVLYAACVTLLALAGIISLTSTLLPFQLLLLSFLVVAIGNMIAMTRQGNPDARLFLIGMSLTMSIAV